MESLNFKCRNVPGVGLQLIEQRGREPTNGISYGRVDMDCLCYRRS